MARWTVRTLGDDTAGIAGIDGGGAALPEPVDAIAKEVMLKLRALATPRTGQGW